MDQDATWCGGRPQPRPHCVRWATSSPRRKGTAGPQFSAQFALAWFAISATAELLYHVIWGQKHFETKGLRCYILWDTGKVILWDKALTWSAVASLGWYVGVQWLIAYGSWMHMIATTCTMVINFCLCCVSKTTHLAYYNCDMQRPISVTLQKCYWDSMQSNVSDLHPKFALRPHHVWKYGRHPICSSWE